MDQADVQLVVLAAGSSVRMGRDKLAAHFDGQPLARRVVLRLADLNPLVVAAPAVAEVLAGVPSARIIVTQPTAGPAATLALADAFVPAGRSLAVVPCDLPFLDAGLVRAFLDRLPAGADLAFPVVAGTPGHPVVWSPKARLRIAALRPEDPPARLRRDPDLRVLAVASADDGYVFDVDTPSAWADAEDRARRSVTTGGTTPMSFLGHDNQRCASDGCGHPKSSHVHDRVMHDGKWTDVGRCIDCEHEGGPCTDAHSVLEQVD